MAAGGDPNEELKRLEHSITPLYVPKMKGATHRSRSHFAIDYTGKARIATRKLPKIVSEGSYDDVYELLKQGADPREADSKGRTPLHFAACRGDIGVVQILISHGASVNKQDDIGNTPLHLACTAGHVGAITALLRAGTDLMAADRRGNTPFHLALSRLRLIDKTPSTAPFPLHKKRQIENIVDMLREYLVLRAENDDDDDDEGLKNTGKTIKHSNIGELERLAGQLTLSDTPEKVDEVHSLLENFTNLSIQRLEAAADKHSQIKS